MKRIAVILLAFSVAGCAPRVAPPGPGPATPALTEYGFQTRDGLLLPVRRWVPVTEPQGVILAVHGFNDYSKSFDVVPDAPGVGPTLAADGFLVFAYDQRGFGAAPHAGLWPGEDMITRDFSDFITVLDQTYPSLPLYAVGVSMGGAVITAAMTMPDAPPADAVVLVAPAVWSRSTMPWLYRASLWAGSRLFPSAKPSGRGLGRQASDNIEMLRDAARDPLFIKDTRIDSIHGLSNLMDQAQKNIGLLSVPTLYLYGANDQIIPPNATESALQKYLTQSDTRRLAYYENGWHMMLRDLQADTVLKDISVFLKDQDSSFASGLPSGADKDAYDRLRAAEK